MKSHLPEGCYFGFRRQSRRAGALLITESTYDPNVEIPRHSHESPYLIYTLNGGQEESLGSRRWTYNPGTLAFHPAGEAHSEKLGPKGMRCLHVEFSKQWSERHSEVSRILEHGAHFQDGRTGWLVQSVYQEFCAMDDVAPAAIEGLVLELLVNVTRQRRHGLAENERPRWLVQAREMIHARFTEPLSLSDVAGAVDVHPVHLSRQFHRHFRSTVADYIRQLRVAWACREISTSSRTLVEIAVEAGFSDQAHFTRVCKRLTGKTPAQFRRQRDSR